MTKKDGSKAIVTGAGLAVLGVALLQFIIPAEVDMSETDGATGILIRPDFWPKVVSWLMIMVGCIYSVIHALRIWKLKINLKVTEYQTISGEGDISARSKGTIFGWGVFSAIIIIFLSASHETGLLLPSIAIFLLASFGFSFSAGSLRFLIALAVPMVLAAFFHFVANVPIPMGLLEFLTWS